MAQKLKGQQEDANGKCQCERCGKRIAQINFYTYKDGSKKFFEIKSVNDFGETFSITNNEYLTAMKNPKEYNLLRGLMDYNYFSSVDYKITRKFVEQLLSLKNALEEFNIFLNELFRGDR